VNRWFGGRLDDLVMFTNALNAAEIAGLATRTVSQFGGLSATNVVTVTVTNYSTPRLGGLAVTNGAWSMSVNGDAGTSYTIQSSTNLMDWATLTTTNPPAMPFVFSEGLLNQPGARFYRAYIGP
jgi:hypothetical protein